MRGDAMLEPAAATLDPAEALAHLEEHGFARLGRVMGDAALEAFRARCDDIMLGRLTYEGLFFQRESTTGNYDDLAFNKGWQGPSLEYRKIEKLERDPLFLAWVENPLFHTIVDRVVGPHVSLFRAVLMTKAATGGTNLPWHQDGGLFWGLDRNPTLQLWTALDDAPVEAGCVEVIPGTHRAGLVTKNGGGVPRDVVEREQADARAVPLPARAGEVLLIHNHVWHRSGLNRSGHPRRALSICYMHGDTQCTRKRRAPRQFVKLFVPR